MSRLPKSIFILFLFALIWRVIGLHTSVVDQSDQTNRTVEDKAWDDDVDFYGAHLKDWSFFNYSSKPYHARSSIVNWGGKSYDPLSFKGGENDTYGLLRTNFMSITTTDLWFSPGIPFEHRSGVSRVTKPSKIFC